LAGVWLLISSGDGPFKASPSGSSGSVGASTRGGGGGGSIVSRSSSGGGDDGSGMFRESHALGCGGSRGGSGGKTGPCTRASSAAVEEVKVRIKHVGLDFDLNQPFSFSTRSCSSKKRPNSLFSLSVKFSRCFSELVGSEFHRGVSVE